MFGTYENLLPVFKETRKIFTVIPNLHKSLHFHFESILLDKMWQVQANIIEDHIQHLSCLIIYFIEYEVFCEQLAKSIIWIVVIMQKCNYDDILFRKKKTKALLSLSFKLLNFNMISWDRKCKNSKKEWPLYLVLTFRHNATRISKHNLTTEVQWSLNNIFRYWKG